MMKIFRKCLISLIKCSFFKRFPTDSKAEKPIDTPFWLLACGVNHPFEFATLCVRALPRFPAYMV